MIVAEEYSAASESAYASQMVVQVLVLHLSPLFCRKGTERRVWIPFFFILFLVKITDKTKQNLLFCSEILVIFHLKAFGGRQILFPRLIVVEAFLEKFAHYLQHQAGFVLRIVPSQSYF